MTKKISIKEFRENGFLQEVNRQFLHPLGLALEVTINEDKSESLSGVWDYREDPEGIHYDLKNSDLDRIKKFQENFKAVEDLRTEKEKQRKKKLGYVVEPIPEDNMKDTKIRIKRLKEEEPSKVRKLRTMLNSLGRTLSDQYADEVKRNLESVVSKFEVASTQRTKAMEPGVLDIVVVASSEEALIQVIKETMDPTVKEKGIMLEFTYKEATVRIIQANDLNFHNTVSMVSGFGVLDMNMKNRIQKDNFKLNRYGIWKGGKLIVANKYDIIRLIDR